MRTLDLLQTVAIAVLIAIVVVQQVWLNQVAQNALKLTEAVQMLTDVVKKMVPR